MTSFRPHRFPPLRPLAASGAGAAGAAGAEGGWAATVAEGFRQGMDEGFAKGRELGEAEGRQAGLEAGRAEGLRLGRDEARSELKESFESLARPIDAVLARLDALRADVELAQRRDVVDLVARVARQVIRAELALQPAQILALVDETLSTLPPAPGRVEVFLHPQELERVREIDPLRAERWTLVADPRLEPGECRVKAGDREADAGCRQRLAACMEQVHAQLVGEPEDEDDMEMSA
jgi:flagellar assembly protein FliH